MLITDEKRAESREQMTCMMQMYACASCAIYGDIIPHELIQFRSRLNLALAMIVSCLSCILAELHSAILLLYHEFMNNTACNISCNRQKILVSLNKQDDNVGCEHIA